MININPQLNIFTCCTVNINSQIVNSIIPQNVHPRESKNSTENYPWESNKSTENIVNHLAHCFVSSP